MYKASPKNLLSLLVAVVCAIAMAIVLAKSGPSAVIALLSTTVTVLLLQVAFLRRDLSTLKDQVTEKQKH
jgi:hypothetical protein